MATTTVRARLERAGLYVAGLLAYTYLGMLFLGVLHSFIPELFPAWGFVTCLVVQAIWNVLFEAFWALRARSKVKQS